MRIYSLFSLSCSVSLASTKYITVLYIPFFLLTVGNWNSRKQSYKQRKLLEVVQRGWELWVKVRETRQWRKRSFILSDTHLLVNLPRALWGITESLPWGHPTQGYQAWVYSPVVISFHLKVFSWSDRFPTFSQADWLSKKTQNLHGTLLTCVRLLFRALGEFWIGWK